MEMSGDVVVERLWDDGAPVNKTTIALNKGFAKYTFTPDVAHINSTLNLVVSQSLSMAYILKDLYKYKPRFKRIFSLG